MCHFTWKQITLGVNCYFLQQNCKGTHLLGKRHFARKILFNSPRTSYETSIALSKYIPKDEEIVIIIILQEMKVSLDVKKTRRYVFSKREFTERTLHSIFLLNFESNDFLKPHLTTISKNGSEVVHLFLLNSFCMYQGIK